MSCEADLGPHGLLPSGQSAYLKGPLNIFRRRGGWRRRREAVSRQTYSSGLVTVRSGQSPATNVAAAQLGLRSAWSRKRRTKESAKSSRGYAATRALMKETENASKPGPDTSAVVPICKSRLSTSTSASSAPRICKTMILNARSRRLRGPPQTRCKDPCQMAASCLEREGVTVEGRGKRQVV